MSNLDWLLILLDIWVNFYVIAKEIRIFLLHSKQNVSLHVNNIFREDELVESSVVKDSLTTARDGKRYITFLLDGRGTTPWGRRRSLS